MQFWAAAAQENEHPGDNTMRQRTWLLEAAICLLCCTIANVIYAQTASARRFNLSIIPPLHAFVLDEGIELKVKVTNTSNEIVIVTGNQASTRDESLFVTELLGPDGKRVTKWKDVLAKQDSSKHLGSLDVATSFITPGHTVQIHVPLDTIYKIVQVGTYT